MADTEKLVFMVTHGPSEPELATIPFVMAAAALASDVAVVMGFQADGVELVIAGTAEAITAPDFPPLAKLLADVRELGGALLVCSPCLKSRGIAPADLVEGAEIVAAARFIAEITSATNALTYWSTAAMTATATELEAITDAKVVDARGTACPGPLLEAKKGMAGVPMGSTIEIWSTDPATKNDISAWSGKVGHDFLGVLEADGYDRVFVIRRK